MFFTEPKFHKIGNQNEVLQKIKRYEHQTNLESPRTLKALDSLGFDKLRFRRKNKFELNAEFELKKLPYTEQDLQNLYFQYLEHLLNDYKELTDQRKVIKDWMKQKQTQEDELRGYKAPVGVQKQKLKESIEVETLEERFQRIEKERIREMEITDCVTKDAILMELEKRKTDLRVMERVERSNISRQNQLMEKKQKAIVHNEQANKTFQEHKEQMNRQLLQSQQKSISFQEKMEERELEIKKKKQLQLQEIQNKNKQNEEYISKRRSMLGHRFESLEQKRFLQDLRHEEQRQRSAEQAVKNRISKQQLFEQRLMQVQQTSENMRLQDQNNLYTSYGQRMLKVESMCKQRDQDVEKISMSLRNEHLNRVVKHKKIVEKLQENQHQMLAEKQEKIQQKEEYVQKQKQKREQEIRQEKEEKLQLLKEHIHQVELNKKIQHKLGDNVNQKSLRITEKLSKQREEQNRVVLYSTISRQRLEQTNLLRLQDLHLLKYNSLDSLLEKIKDLVDEEEFEELKNTYKAVDNPQQKLEEIKRLAKKGSKSETIKK